MPHNLYARFRYGTSFTRLLLICCCLFILPELRAQQATEEWSKRFHGVFYNVESYATSIAVDGAGNSYVTGGSERSGRNSSTIVTIKYSPAGQRIWLSEFDAVGSGKLVLDNAGGVYVVGSGSTGYLTVRYDAATGAQSWLSKYDLPAGSFNFTAGIAVDNAGGVYITGYSTATVRYDAATGTQSWVSMSFPGAATAIAADNAGGVYVTGRSSTGALTCATVRYDAATGTQSWISPYPGDATAIAVDNAGGVYATGKTNSGGTDFATVRYNATTGVPSWTSRYNGTRNSYDKPYAIAVDNTGGVYVTGETNSSVGSDYATVRYVAATGVQSWASMYASPRADFARAIAVDNAGGVYVTGETVVGPGIGNYANTTATTTLRYNATDGAVVWTKQKSDVLSDRKAAIVVDKQGNVLVTGSALYSTSAEYLTVKYSQTAPVDNPFTFCQAINLNGPALTLDGHAWQGSSSTTPNYSTNGTAFQNQSVVLSPATDATRASMIRSSVYRTGSLRVTLSAVPAGAYQVYAYVWEDNSAEVYDLLVNGQVVRSGYNSGAAGTWNRLGPYNVTLAAAGSVQLTTSGGTANVSGIELWKQQTTVAKQPSAAITTTSLPALAVRGMRVQSQAYPNPSSDGRFHLVLPAALQGDVAYVLMSAVGKPLREGTLSVPATGTADLDFSQQMKEFGVCYLQLKGANGQAYLKLLRY